MIHNNPSLVFTRPLEFSLASYNLTWGYQVATAFTSQALFWFCLSSWLHTQWKFPCLISVNCVQDVDSEVLQHLKRLGRKDPTTKVRLLIRFISILCTLHSIFLVKCYCRKKNFSLNSRMLLLLSGNNLVMPYWCVFLSSFMVKSNRPIPDRCHIFNTMSYLSSHFLRKEFYSLCILSLLVCRKMLQNHTRNSWWYSACALTFFPFNISAVLTCFVLFLFFPLQCSSRQYLHSL